MFAYIFAIYLNVANNLVQVSNVMQFNFPSACNVIVLRDFYTQLLRYECLCVCVAVLKRIQTKSRMKCQCFYAFNLFMTFYFP